MTDRRVPHWVVQSAPRPRRSYQPGVTPVIRGETAAAEVRGLFAWLRSRYWGNVGKTQGFEEDRAETEVHP